MENKILVTGGYGLVGSEFRESNYIPLSSSDVDLRNRNEVDKMFKKVKFDRELINKWITDVEKDINKKNFDFGYRLDEINKLKQKLQEMGAAINGKKSELQE